MWPSSGSQNTKDEGIKEYKMKLQDIRSKTPHDGEFSYTSLLPRHSNQRDSSAPYSQKPPACVPLSVLET